MIRPLHGTFIFIGSSTFLKGNKRRRIYDTNSNQILFRDHLRLLRFFMGNDRTLTFGIFRGGKSTITNTRTQSNEQTNNRNSTIYPTTRRYNNRFFLGILNHKLLAINRNKTFNGKLRDRRMNNNVNYLRTSGGIRTSSKNRRIGKLIFRSNLFSSKTLLYGSLR